jgi:hypothetical protein
MWGVEILPFIEQAQAFSLYFHQASLENATQGSVSASNQGRNRELAMMRMTIYECPSDPGAGRQSFPRTEVDDNGNNVGNGYTPFLQYQTSYRGVAGANTGGSWWWHWDAGGGGPTSGAVVRSYMRGIFHNYREHTTGQGGLNILETMATVRDGLSNTMMFVEHPEPNDSRHARRTSYWSSVSRNHVYTMSPQAATLLSHDWAACIATAVGTADERIWYCSYSAGSYHTGGMNAAVADGAVRFINRNINVGIGWAADRTDLQMIGVWGCLCAVDSGTAVSLP